MLPPLISIWLCPAVSVMLLAGVSRCSKGLAKRSTGSARACPPWAFLASCPPTLPSVAALRLGVHLLGVVLQRLLGVVAGQALRALLAGALPQGLAQLAGAFELRHGLHRVHLTAGHAAAHGWAGRGGEQQAKARALGTLFWMLCNCPNTIERPLSPSINSTSTSVPARRRG